MFVVADISVHPLLPVGFKTTPEDCLSLFTQTFTHHQLKCHVHSNGTNVEGDINKIMECIKIAHSRIHKQLGCPKIALDLRILSRIGGNQPDIEESIGQVEQKAATS